MFSMKRLQPAIGFLISVLIILSAVVLPAAESVEVCDKGVPAEITQVNVGSFERLPEADTEADFKDTENIIETVETEYEETPEFRDDKTDEKNPSIDEDDFASGFEMSRESFTQEEVVSSEPIRKNAEPDVPTIDTLIPLNFDESYSGVLPGPDDRYVYFFTVPERGYIHYTVSHAELHNFTGWEAVLYREYYLNGVDGEIGYMPMNVLKTTAIEKTDAAPSIGVMPGEYRIVLKTSSGASEEEYTLKVSFTPAFDHEIECNDSKAAYTELYPGITMIGSASCYADKQDTDWYLLRVQKDGKIDVTFTHEKSDSVSVAWRISLYDDAGVELYAENSGMSTETVYSGEIGVAKGVYFIAVSCRVRSDSDYSLTVNTFADGQFERENNDTKDSANELSLGGSVSGCVTAKAGKLDRDYFRFEMPARGNFALVFTHAPAALKDDKNGWNIKLYSASGSLLYAMISTWNVGSVRMPVLGLEAGVYYVEINSEDMYRSALTYTLIAGYNESSGFEMEPNNSFECANPIAQGVSVTGAIIDGVDPDDDCYCLTVSVYSRITVVLDHEEGGTDRDIFSFSVCNEAGERMPLYSGAEQMKDADGNAVFFVKSFASQPSVSGYYELPPGTYYLTVTSGRFFDTMNYTVTYYVV